MTVSTIKIAITNSEGYEEEFVKNLYETIIANGKRLEELERAEKIRLEKLVKDQALKEKELQLKFDLERFKIESGFRGSRKRKIDLGKLPPDKELLFRRVQRERTFEKRVIQRCYHCNMPGHIKTVCPKLIKNKTTETLNNIEGNENPDFLNSYTTKVSVNGHEIDILRDTRATIDLVCAKYINPSSFSGENVWVKQPLSPELVCLPLAVVEISGNFGTVQTKATVCGNHLNQHGRYLLGNKTAELIKGNLGYNFLPVEILNAVQTRSQVKAAREEREIDSGDAKKGEDEVIIVSSDAEDEILIPALQEYVRN
ncbi:CCHC-type domain-containing protein [Trichonephila clavipes]|uniref:CCHC-type domain-containing protein n=1 Tax=Trichonephila clavipes TaxID=2585209 RepID=A0A8X6SHG3_TRICX|nr:CCHC-type domain-containing protein [Trichonephila clavipes]